MSFQSYLRACCSKARSSVAAGLQGLLTALTHWRHAKFPGQHLSLHGRDRNFCSVTSDMTQIAHLVCSMTILFTIGKSHWLRGNPAVAHHCSTLMPEFAKKKTLVDLEFSRCAERTDIQATRDRAKSCRVLSYAAVKAAAFKIPLKKKKTSRTAKIVPHVLHVNVCSLCGR